MEGGSSRTNHDACVFWCVCVRERETGEMEKGSRERRLRSEWNSYQVKQKGVGRKKRGDELLKG